MTQEIGESREEWGRDIWNKAEDFASKISSEMPFYVVFSAKSDRQHPHVFRQAFKAYYQRPPHLIGILVWYVDKSLGLFDLVSELSIPPDVPIDPALLSKEKQDTFASLMEVGEKMGVLLS